MNIHSETYKRIRDNIIRTWPAWKRKIYNSCFAVSAHAEKLPEDDRTRSTPVWTNYDRLISKTPEEMARFIASQRRDCYHCPVIKCVDTCKVSWLNWLKAPANKEGER